MLLLVLVVQIRKSGWVLVLVYSLVLVYLPCSDSLPLLPLLELLESLLGLETVRSESGCWVSRKL